MRTEWILTYKNYVAAQHLHTRQKLWRRFYMFSLLWLLPGFIVLVSLIFLIGSIHRSDREETWRGFAQIWPVLFFVFIFRLSYWWNLRKGYKRIFLNGDPTQSVYMDLDEERLVSGVPGSSEGKFFWPTIQRFVEGKDIAILYISDRLFLMIPKKQLKPVEWEEMRSFILAHTHQSGK